MDMLRAFIEFKNNFKGDPRAEIDKLLQSGQITQQQLNQAQQKAKEYMSLFNSLGGNH